jgi:iron complex outermembrane receptor protein
MLKLAIGGRLDAWRLGQTDRTIDPATLDPVTTTAQTTRTTSAFTWRAGLVFQPTAWATVYGSAATAFRPAKDLPVDNHQLSPERGRQFELGARAEWPEVQVSVAAYDLAKTDVVVARGAGVFDQAGRQTARGVELDATLKPWTGLAVHAGYAYTRARYDDFQADGQDYSGKTPPNVAEYSLTVWSTYRAPFGLGFGLGGRALGASFADPADHVELGAYAVVDAAIYYRADPFELALNLNNSGHTAKHSARRATQASALVAPWANSWHACAAGDDPSAL